MPVATHFLEFSGTKMSQNGRALIYGLTACCYHNHFITLHVISPCLQTRTEYKSKYKTMPGFTGEPDGPVAGKSTQKLGTLYIFILQIRTVLSLLHSERPKLYGVLAVLSAIGLKKDFMHCILKKTVYHFILIFSQIIV